MGLRRVPYRSLAALLARELVVGEEPATAALVAELRHVKRSGRFTRAEFLAMCRWKSPRAIRHCRRNSAAAIRRVSRAVFATRSERRRMELLTGLHGVSVPTASAILTLVAPRRYGVLDIRAWQLLFGLGRFRRKPAGRGFALRDWLDYLAELRRHARRLGVSARAVELTLFLCHRRLQKGRLYA
ncbi:MAG TPA: hypothetical protein VKG64_10965 [Methylomirabilota bacterium]|jgi:hypothetical protein|nr:hypothetical protein [Methylomirabilota bacterium]